MVQIGIYLVSLDLFEEEFTCHLEKCFGNCCVHGDAGAPLKDSEADMLDKIYPDIKEYLSENGNMAIREQGSWVIDDDGEKVTPLINGRECAYTVFRNRVAFCGIEHAFEEGKTSFRKPVSCHLYPIRLSRVGDLVALNYHRWGICEPARILGKQNKQPVFRFLKGSITRVFGEGFYDEMEKVYQEFIAMNSGKQGS